MPAVQLLIGNTMNVLVEGLQFEGESTYINDGAVEVTIFDSDEAEVAGETWPLELDYVSSSNGNYEGVLTADLELVRNHRYTVEITATKSGNTGKWREKAPAQDRRFSS